MACLALGLLVAGCGDSFSDDADAATPDPPSSAVAQPIPTTSIPASPVPTTPIPTTRSTEALEPERPTAVVVQAGGLTDEFAAVIQSLPGVREAAVVQLGRIHLVESVDSGGTTVDDPPDGFVIQLDAVAYEDVDSARPFAPELLRALDGLMPDEVVLSESSAALRRLDRGSTITLDNGTEVTVGLVLPDDVVGATEMVFVGPEALTAAGLTEARKISLVDYEGEGQELERALLAANDGTGIRVFGGAGGDDQRDRDRAVLAQLQVKELFGEFAFRRRADGSLEIDPAWVEANIVTVDLPLLGATKCHRLYTPILTEVLQGLIDDGLSEVIDPVAFQGCWNPRFIAGSDRLSRHAWGIAADINFFNPLDGGPGSPVHPELLERMSAAGVTSGHNWSSPDPGHFEFLRAVDQN